MPRPSIDTSQPSEKEIRNRVDSCDEPEIINELIDFGLMMKRDSLDRVRAVEYKAMLFAGYGAAIVTFLVSSSKTWIRLGNQWTPWIAVCAALCASMCTYMSVSTLILQQAEDISPDEWLQKDCLSDMDMLKRYRIVTLWGVTDSRNKEQKDKSTNLRRAEVWLIGSVIFLLYLIFHVAFLRSVDQGFGLIIKKFQGISGWSLLPFSSPSNLGGLTCFLVLGITLFMIYRRSRQVI